MKLTINNKQKLDSFVAIFQLLKNWSSTINLQFKKDELYIQSMDKSHVCLSDITIKSDWFTSYDLGLSQSEFNLVVDCNNFFIIIAYSQKNNNLCIEYGDGEDILHINLVDNEKNKNEYDRFFELPLLDVETLNMEIPSVDYDAEFSIDSKKFSELISQLSVFGTSLDIKCTEEIIELNAHGDIGKLKVNIPIDDLSEYSISEGDTIELSYSLSHLNKMCLSTKISANIDIGISSNFPMLIKYDLGESSNALFYVAPKMNDTN